MTEAIIQNGDVPHVKNNNAVKSFTRAEVTKHNKDGDRWLIIDQEVYDITRFSKRHPGGEHMINLCSGQDGTDAFNAFHPDMKKCRKYLKPLRVGTCSDEPSEITKDFRKLRSDLESLGLYKTNYLFFFLVFMQFVIFPAISITLFHYFGVNIYTFSAGVLLMVIEQAQCGWNMHDFGHLSVFHSVKIDRFMQFVVLSVFKGGCCDWWNSRHNSHHAKTNVAWKDPDVSNPELLMIGTKIPVEYGAKKQKGLLWSYKHQDKFFAIFWPLVIGPIFIQIDNFFYAVSRFMILDLLIMATFYIKFGLMFVPYLGLSGCLIFYVLVRLFEAQWFIWVSQMSHVPMELTPEIPEGHGWVEMNLDGTCNVHQSFFNDWFTGHLNHQIEHHLFPTIPRHNLHKTTPFIKSLLKKHGIPYTSKPLFTAFADILRSLKKSGEIWAEAYDYD